MILHKSLFVFVYEVTKPLQECMTEMPKQTKFYETALADRNN